MALLLAKSKSQKPLLIINQAIKEICQRPSWQRIKVRIEENLQAGDVLEAAGLLHIIQASLHLPRRQNQRS